MNRIKTCTLLMLSVFTFFIGCTEPTDSQTIIINEKREEYKITFNANGGSGTMSDINIEAQTSIVLPENTFTRTGYDFLGWSTTSNGEVMYKNADIFEGLYSNIILYAVWKNNTGSTEKTVIVFNANGGNGFMEYQTANINTPIRLSDNIFIREGYTFIGWAEKKDGLKKYDNMAEIVLDSNDELTLYAVWEPIKYKIMFMVNLDSNWGVKNPENITIDYDKVFKLPELDNINGYYYFRGWNTTEDGIGETYFCNEEVKNLESRNNAVLYLYAKWTSENEHVINYVLNGGTNDKNNQATFYEDQDVTLYAPSHPDSTYSFAGWYDNEFFSGSEITLWNANEKHSDVTLYAKWDKPTYKVTLVSKVDSENVVKISLNMTYKSNMPKIVIPEREGDYEFGGYFTMENGLGKQYYNANGESIAVYDKNEDLTLYAYWIKKIYNFEVTFLANNEDASSIGMKVTVIYGENMPDVEPSSSRNENYIFNGYFTEENGLGEQYYTADGKSLKKYELKNNLILYAAWKLKTYSVTFNANDGTLTGDEIQEVEYRKKATKPSDPIRDYYVFSGWYTSTDYGTTLSSTMYDFETEITKDITLYAKWVSMYDSIVKMIEKHTGDEPLDIPVIGTITNDTIFGIKNALKYALNNNMNTRINLDLSQTTGVTYIREYAFDECSNLISVTIPDSVTSIGDSAFSDCYGLTSITIPDSVTSLGNSAFFACNSLTSVTIPDNLTFIGDSVFRGCSSLTSVTIPNSITSIGTYVFYGCNSLTSVTIPDNVTFIGDSVFKDCSSLTSITIPNSVTSIGDSAFSDCYGLTSVTIPDGVTYIDNYAFYGCNSLTEVNYRGTQEQWNAINIGVANDSLTDATINYNYTGE